MSITEFTKPSTTARVVNDSKIDTITTAVSNYLNNHLKTELLNRQDNITASDDFVFNEPLTFSDTSFTAATSFNQPVIIRNAVFDSTLTLASTDLKGLHAYTNKIGVESLEVSVSSSIVTFDSPVGSAIDMDHVSKVILPSKHNGHIQYVRLQDAITLNMSGCTFGYTAATGSSIHIRLYVIVDNGKVKFGLGLLGGLKTIPISITKTLAAQVIAANHILVNEPLTPSNRCYEFGFMRMHYSGTGTTWIADNIIIGKKADGYWNPWQPVYFGFSTDPAGPTSGGKQWTQIGERIFATHGGTTAATSNNTNFLFSLPIRPDLAEVLGASISPATLVDVAIQSYWLGSAVGTDNGTIDTEPSSIKYYGWVDPTSQIGQAILTTYGSSFTNKPLAFISFSTLALSNGSWTSSGSKNANFFLNYKVFEDW